MTKVFGWMSLALIVTAAVSFGVASTPQIVEIIFSSKFTFYGLMIAEVGVVWWLSSRVATMSATSATVWFFLYSILNGLTLSVIFFIFTADSIVYVFGIAASMFMVMAAYGYYTKKDLTSWGSLLMMGVIGLVIAGVVNIFLRSDMFGMIVSSIGVLIFVGLTAYDTQKIKEMNIIGNEGTDEDHKEAIMGALTLYLDFINLFLYLLRLLGNRRD
ncbi:Bax inhibitor-1/YccA family protein [Flectobacillus sp. DC10W]|uniref:Bax inhibitor-1/YccA family protein n=2 Tax=Flectobacillus longus TaxID=2984207 RepID=A0ABT6YMJ7_9BACT|nr:Bax inhibitor-1/YccA family protein [Flectobacillus longus]MDI9864827.1 Bax inhibitor-1/YccA family protein [Flectobacillus longus]